MRRGLSKSEAADYLSLSLSAFDLWISEGRIPGPIPGTRRWDRKAIDLALDRLSRIKQDNAYDRSKARDVAPVEARKAS